MDEQVPVLDIVRDPITELERLDSYAHPRLPVPVALYSERRNSIGLDLGNPRALETARAGIASRRPLVHTSGPVIDGIMLAGETHAVTNPADRRDTVGRSRDATGTEIAQPSMQAARAQPAWDARGGGARAECLDRAAALLEKSRLDFYDLLIREAGKTLPDAVAEVREATDFCRYYALRAREEFAHGKRLEGPTGEYNELSLHGRGVFACISPWNFPLAIFAGQVTAALAAGNAVVAKPAEPTPLIAARFVRLLHEAGVPPEVLQLTPSPGRMFGDTAFAPSGARGRRHDGIDRHRAHHQPHARRARRRHRAAHRRNRRHECHAGRLDRAARAGGRRCDHFGLHERGTALLGAALVVPAGGNRRRRARDDRGGDG